MTTLAVISGGSRTVLDTPSGRPDRHRGAQGSGRDRHVGHLDDDRAAAAGSSDHGRHADGCCRTGVGGAFDAVASADGLIAVTPAFNASFSGLFKSFFDVLPEQTLWDMPVLIAATGGTERHSLVLDHALRPMFSYSHAILAPTGLYAATDDFGAQRGSGALSERIDTAARDFARLLSSCGARTRRDAFADELTEMQRLLGAASQRKDTTTIED